MAQSPDQQQPQQQAVPLKAITYAVSHDRGWLAAGTCRVVAQLGLCARAHAAVALAAAAAVACRRNTQGLLRALDAEAESLQKVHVRIQRQLQNLEVRCGCCCSGVAAWRRVHGTRQHARLRRRRQHRLPTCLFRWRRSCCSRWWRASAAA